VYPRAATCSGSGGTRVGTLTQNAQANFRHFVAVSHERRTGPRLRARLVQREKRQRMHCAPPARSPRLDSARDGLFLSIGARLRRRVSSPTGAVGILPWSWDLLPFFSAGPLTCAYPCRSGRPSLARAEEFRASRTSRRNPPVCTQHSAVPRLPFEDE